jgi:hypothetical protein
VVAVGVGESEGVAVGSGVDVGVDVSSECNADVSWSALAGRMLFPAKTISNNNTAKMNWMFLFDGLVF